ncbi:hypothetical protein D3C78_1097280 [compost metagenome]
MRLTSARQALELEFADKTSASLGQGKFERLLQLGGQGGQILVHQLFLQGHGGGGDQHAGAARQCQRNGGNAVSQRFAHARAGLDHGDGAFWIGGVVIELTELGGAERLGDLARHEPLALAAAKARDGCDDFIERFKAQLGPLLLGH